jgi:hypothetical protein
MMMRRDACQLSASVLQMRARLAADWKWLAENLGAPHLLSLAFFDPSFVVGSDRAGLLAAAVDAAVALGGADMGNVQLREPGRGVLQIEAQRGFAPPFLEFFADVRDGEAACGVAAERGARVIVEDVARSPIFRATPALDVMLDAGARAVQSMPLLSPSGCLLAVLSTHWHHPWRPRERELRLLGMLERRLTCVLEWTAARAGLGGSGESLRQGSPERGAGPVPAPPPHDPSV